MINDSRRHFLKLAAVGGLASALIPDSLAADEKEIPAIKSFSENGLVILFQGDSITDGNRGRNADPNHIMGHGYAFSVASRLGYAFPEKKLTFMNRGISGNKVDDLEKRWKEDALDLKPNVLSILVGINDSSSFVNPVDGWEPVSPQKYNEVYRSLLDQVVRQNPGITLVINQPFAYKMASTIKNWELRVGDLAERQKIAEKIAKDYKAVFVRLQDAFDLACKRAPADYWIWEGIHPTVAGHEVIAREWLKEVGKKLTFLG